MVEQHVRRHVESDQLLGLLEDRHRHHRVQAQLGERRVQADRRRRHPQFAAQDGLQPGLQFAETLLGGQRRPVRGLGDRGDRVLADGLVLDNDDSGLELRGDPVEVVEFAELRGRRDRAVQPQPSDTDPGERAADQGLQRLDAFVGRDRVEHAVGELAAHADGGPLSPVDRGGGPPGCASPRHQRVEPRVAGRVGQLTRQPQQGGHRREAHPPVHLPVGGRRVQPQRAGHLGRPDPFQTFPGQRTHQAVAGDAGAVHEAAQRPPGLFGRGHQPLRHPCGGDVAGHEHDFGALAEAGQVLALRVGGLAAAVEHDPARAALDQPAGDDGAQTAQATGDDVGAVGADHRVVPVAVQGGAHQPFHVAAVFAQRDDVVSGRGGKFVGQRGDRRPRCRRRAGWHRDPVRRPARGPPRRGTASCG